MAWKLHPIDEFTHHLDQWQYLNLEAAASPLLDQAFISPLLQVFGSGKEILACHEKGGQTQAMAILTPHGRRAWGTFQPSQAPLGPWMHTSDMDWPTLLSGLIKKLPGFPLVLGITQQDPDLVSRPQDSGEIKTRDYIQTARISIQENFEHYWNARGKNLRQNMKKQRTKLDKRGVTTRLQVSTAPEEVAQAITDYGGLETAGWKATGGTAIHSDNAQGQFYRTMLELFCGQGRGRIYRYWYNNQIAAMDLCIEGKDSLIILKTTYDESINDGTSPALLMREEQCRQLFDEGRFKKIEFYGSLMEWHTKWSEEIRTIYHITNYRWPILSHVHRLMSNASVQENPARLAIQTMEQSCSTWKK